MGSDEFKAKLSESFKSVMPVNIIVILLSFFIVPMPVDITLMFFVGSFFLILGIALFTLGAEIAMVPMGELLGAYVIKKRSLAFLVFMGFTIGFIVAVAEPGLAVFASQVAAIPNQVLILSVAAGLGVFLAIACVRTMFRANLSYVLLAIYGIIVFFAFMVPDSFLPIAFDAGGSSTGSLTVPFIMALGLGISSVRSDSDAESDSFGLVAICALGPILAVMLLGTIFDPDAAAPSVEIISAEYTNQIWYMFVGEILPFMRDVTMALSPIVVLFLIFQVLAFKLPKKQLIRLTKGIAYSFAGLVLFLTGANMGFLPAGNALGQQLGYLNHNWILIPIGMILGYVVISAEPAVYVLNEQVHKITEGAISTKSMGLSLSIGVAASLGISMVRVLTGLPILWVLLPMYAIAIGLSFFVPKIFTSIAFDSGGVASGALTSTFLLPLTVGASVAVGGNVTKDAFGVIAMVATTPLITIQILGLYYKIKIGDSVVDGTQDIDDEFFDLEDEN